MNQNIVDGVALLAMLILTVVYSFLARRRSHIDTTNLEDVVPEDHIERRVTCVLQCFYVACSRCVSREITCTS